MNLNQQTLQGVIDEVVDRVMRSIDGPVGAGLSSGYSVDSAPSSGLPTPSTGDGVFDRMEDAVAAASEAFLSYRKMSLEFRGAIVEALRRESLAHKEELARDTVQETGMGRVAHKIMKFDLVATKTPGIEYLTTWCKTGDHGLTIEELAPYGLVAVVTPSTHPVPTLINNAISLLSAGNTLVANPHPASKRVFAKAVALFNRALVKAGAPANLITTVREPTIESAHVMFRHPAPRLILVTGGAAVVNAALSMPKRAITAGPGNPPVIVDETADLPKAARDVIAGAAFDNNIICIAEKEVFVVESVADVFKKELIQRGCVELNSAQIDALAKVAFPKKEGAEGVTLNRELVGRSAKVLAKIVGLDVPESTPLLIGEVPSDHLWVQKEQMMPFLPLTRAKDVYQAIDWALEAERGFRHTAIMHSRNIESMSIMAQRCDCSIFIKNAPSLAGLGAGGEGHTSFSIAGPTGEGLTTCRTFSRLRRCVLVDYFRII